MTGVALVTGAAGGIGAAVVRALAAEGRPVAALDLVAPVDGLPLVADVTDAEQVEAAVVAAEDALGPLDVLVNAAGVLPTGPILDLDPADWARAFAVNVDGVLHASQAVGRRMRDRGVGSIVTIASNAAGVPRAGMGAYASSKAAAMMLTRCLGLELASSGVRCNIVCPGSTDTPMLLSLSSASDAIVGSPSAFKVGIPLGRIASPSDIADAVVFLSSSNARHITMQALYVDGGATLRG